MSVLSKEELKKRLLDLNDEQKPFRIVDGGADADIIVEWKIVDAKWYETFSKAGLKRVFKIYVTLDDQKKMVRTLDKEFTVEWKAGVPSLSSPVGNASFKKDFFIGQKFEAGGEAVFGVKEDGSFGKIYSHQFNTEEMKRLLRQIVTDAGWQYGSKTMKKILKGCGIAIAIPVFLFILLMIFA